VGEVLEVELVLLPLRLVEPELLALVSLELRGALAAAQRRDRVTGESAEEDEVERDHDEDRQRREQDSFRDEIEAPHRPLPVFLLPDLVRPRPVHLRVRVQVRVHAVPCRRVRVDVLLLDELGVDPVVVDHLLHLLDDRRALVLVDIVPRFS
jgi:hypothetical protein